MPIVISGSVQGLPPSPPQPGRTAPPGRHTHRRGRASRTVAIRRCHQPASRAPKHTGGATARRPTTGTRSTIISVQKRRAPAMPTAQGRCEPSKPPAGQTPKAPRRRSREVHIATRRARSDDQGNEPNRPPPPAPRHARSTRPNSTAHTAIEMATGRREMPGRPTNGTHHNPRHTARSGGASRSGPSRRANRGRPGERSAPAHTPTPRTPPPTPGRAATGNGRRDRQANNARPPKQPAPRQATNAARQIAPGQATEQRPPTTATPTAAPRSSMLPGRRPPPGSRHKTSASDDPRRSPDHRTDAVASFCVGHRPRAAGVA